MPDSRREKHSTLKGLLALGLGAACILTLLDWVWAYG